MHMEKLLRSPLFLLFIVLVVLGITLVPPLPSWGVSDAARAAGISTPYAISQGQWTKVDLGTLISDFRAIWGTSPSDIYVVGSRYTILHYDGTSWSRVGPNNLSYYLYDVWGSASNDVYVLGEYGEVYHYNGSTWSNFQLTQAGSSLGLSRAYSIWGTGPDNIFIVGGNDSGTASTEGRIFHYDGSTWSLQFVVSSLGYLWFNHVWGLSPTEVYALTNTGEIYRYDGTLWQPMSSPTTSALFGMWGTSSSNLYIVGESGRAYHYDGSSWSPLTLPLNRSTDYIYGIWGTSATDIYAVGDSGSIVHYDGSTWSSMNSGVTNGLRDVWGTSSIVYAVGNETTILYHTASAATPTPTSTPTSTSTPTPTPTSTPTATPTPTTEYIVVTDTPTPTPTPTPTTTREYHFEGAVKDSAGNPLIGVLIRLLARTTEEEAWNAIQEVYTDRQGLYALYRQEVAGYRDYRVVEVDPPGYVSTGAEAAPGGTVIDYNTIEFLNPPSGYYRGNVFYDAKAPPTPTPTPTPGIPILTMGVSGEAQKTCPSSDEWRVQNIILSVNEVSDWQVSSITFNASGTGNEKDDIQEAHLYYGNRLLGTARYDRDNGSISFSFGLHIPKGGTVRLRLTYKLDPDKMTWDARSKTFQVTTSVKQLGAIPLDPPTDKYEKLPPNPIVGPEHEIARVWNVSLKPEKGFGTIQGGIDADVTVDGHTLEVCPDTYRENVRVTKELTILAQSPLTSLIEAAQPDAHAVEITRNNTTIHGFVIYGATGEGKASIAAHPTNGVSNLTNVQILKNRLEGNDYGLFFKDVANSLVRDNILQNNRAYGAYLGPNILTNDEEQRIRFERNKVSHNGGGIFLDGVFDALITDNTVEKNRARASLTQAEQQLPLGHGVYLRDSHMVHLRNNKIGHHSGHGIVVEGGGSQTTSNVLEGDAIYDSGGYGIYVKNAKYTRIINPILISNAGDAIYIEGGEGTRISQEDNDRGKDCSIDLTDAITASARAIVVTGGARDTRVVGCTLALRDTDTGIYGENATNLTARANLIFYGTYGVYLKNVTGFLMLEKNALQDQKEEALRCEDSRDLDIRQGNEFFLPGKAALAFYRCTTTRRDDQNRVWNNIIDGRARTKQGIYIEDSSSLWVGENTMRNLVETGVAIANAQGIEVARNTIADVQQNGVIVSSAQDVDIRENTLTNISQDAVAITSSQDVQVQKNTINGVGRTGVRAVSSSKVILQENTIQYSAAQSGIRPSASSLPINGMYLVNLSDSRIVTNTVRNMVGRGIMARGGQNMVVSGNTIQGNNGGLLLWESPAQVRGNTVKDNRGYGIFLYKSEKTTVAGNTVGPTALGMAQDPAVRRGVNTTGGHGILQFWGKENRIEGNEVTYSAGTGIYLECYGQTMDKVGCERTAILKNEVAANTGHGILISYGDHVNVKGNLIANNSGDGIYLHHAIAATVAQADDETPNRIREVRNGIAVIGGGGHHIWSNQVSKPREHGITLVNTTKNTVWNNEISDAAKDGIHLEKAPRNTGWDGSSGIELNRVTKSGRYGIYLDESPENRIGANTVEDSPYDGIYLRLSHKSRVQGNKVYRSGRYGIHFQETHQSEISKNIVQEQGEHGIVLDSGSQRNVLKENLVGMDKGNGGDGLRLAYAHKNEILNNQFQFNKGHGVSLFVAEGNKIENNTFVENEGDGVYSDGSRQTQILNNRFEDNKGNAIALKNSTVDRRARRTVVRGNRATQNYDFGWGKNGILVDTANYIEILSNIVTNHPEYGIYINRTDHTTVLGNRLLNNCGGIYIQNSQFLAGTMGNNTINNSWCLFTGIHLKNASPRIEGNQISGNAGDGIIAEEGSNPEIVNNAITNNGRDGIRTMSGSQPTVRDNTFNGNAAFGLRNEDTSVTVDARGNWWGDASGPSGEGPGSGDAVSAGVDFTGWLPTPAGLTARAEPAELWAPPSGQVVAHVYLQTLTALPAAVTVTVGDEQGWTPAGYSFRTTITETAGMALPITITVPANAAPGTVNTVRVTATSEGDPSQEATTTFQVQVTAPVQWASILGPTMLDLGETATFTALVMPQDAAELLFLWQPDPAEGQGESSATFTWDTPGLHTVTLEVEQFGQTFQVKKLVAVGRGWQVYLPMMTR
ncbi:MAG: PKD domain-containing protein [Chloroflexi bacterium]|nr:PKD domain-containing protein [Chloroflexota bacterium]